MEAILTKAAIAGGKVLLKYFNTELEIKTKSTPGDYVTQADVESQEAVIKTLKELMIKNGYNENEIGFIGEESLNDERKFSFIIDPLDSTRSFALGKNNFAISIAYSENKNIIAGLVYQPTTNIFYFAEKNKGSFVNKNGEKTKLKIKKINPSDCKVALMLPPHDEKVKKALELVKKIKSAVKEIKETRCTALSGSKVAENEYNFLINPGVFLWDVAALEIILGEAGGTITDFEGSNLTFDWDNVNKPFAVLMGRQDIIKKFVMKFYE